MIAANKSRAEYPEKPEENSLPVFHFQKHHYTWPKKLDNRWLCWKSGFSCAKMYRQLAPHRHIWPKNSSPQIKHLVTAIRASESSHGAQYRQWISNPECSLHIRAPEYRAVRGLRLRLNRASSVKGFNRINFRSYRMIDICVPPVGKGG